MAVQGSSLVVGGGELAQMENVPLPLFPYSQTRIKIVAPGVNPEREIMDIAPLGESSSSHSSKVNDPQVPV